MLMLIRNRNFLTEIVENGHKCRNNNEVSRAIN